jgi:ATP-dependent RNA helicase RhlE
MMFAELRLVEPILRALVDEGYSVATPIQAQAIPHALAGRDVLGCAQTGTGKTAAFALPVLQRFLSTPNQQPAAGTRPKARCLVLCPTRELATQIGDSFRAYGRHVRHRHTVIFGGVGQGPQVDALRRGVETIVATPGRLLDLMEQRHVDLSGVEVLVLDESDRMLDMGFINDIRKIVARVPAKRQTMLFSATMPTEIRRLADSLLHNPATVQVAPVASTADRIEESVYFVDRRNKPALLAHLVNHLPMTRAIVFTRTKHGADRVVRQLHSRGIRAEAIHGNKSQNVRVRALQNFKSSRTPVLVATDVASRGIDIDDVTHVVNYDLTHEPETYVHRIGRTARAGATGVAVSFCDHEERTNLRAIEKLIRRSIPVCDEHPPYPAAEAREMAAVGQRPAAQRQHHRPHDADSRRPLHSHGHGHGHGHGSAPRQVAQPAQSDRRGHAPASRPAAGRPRHPQFGHSRPKSRSGGRRGAFHRL